MLQGRLGTKSSSYDKEAAFRLHKKILFPSPLRASAPLRELLFHYSRLLAFIRG
jgi:hypothetical protein